MPPSTCEAALGKGGVLGSGGVFRVVVPDGGDVGDVCDVGDVHCVLEQEKRISRRSTCNNKKKKHSRSNSVTKS